MTREDFDKLADGTKVWYSPTYFAFPMPGTIKTVNGVKGVWVNFYGDGQCFFSPTTCGEQKFLDALSTFREIGNP